MCTLVDLFWSLNRCCQPISSHLHPISINFSPISIFPPTTSISSHLDSTRPSQVPTFSKPWLLIQPILYQSNDGIPIWSHINPSFFIWNLTQCEHVDSLHSRSTPSLLNVNQLHPILIAINGKNLLIPCTVSTPSSSPLSLSLHNHSTREATSCYLNIGIRSVCCMPMHL